MSTARRMMMSAGCCRPMARRNSGGGDGGSGGGDAPSLRLSPSRVLLLVVWSAAGCRRLQVGVICCSKLQTKRRAGRSKFDCSQATIAICFLTQRQLWTRHGARAPSDDNSARRLCTIDEYERARARFELSRSRRAVCRSIARLPSATRVRPPHFFSLAARPPFPQQRRQRRRASRVSIRATTLNARAPPSFCQFAPPLKQAATKKKPPDLRRVGAQPKKVERRRCFRYFESRSRASPAAK